MKKLIVKCLRAGNIRKQIPRGVLEGWFGKELNEKLTAVLAYELFRNTVIVAKLTAFLHQYSTSFSKKPRS